MEQQKCKVEGCEGELKPTKNPDGTEWKPGWYKCTKCGRVQGHGVVVLGDYR